MGEGRGGTLVERSRSLFSRGKKKKMFRNFRTSIDKIRRIRKEEREKNIEKIDVR